jgi:hypothetical protein
MCVKSIYWPVRGVCDKVWIEMWGCTEEIGGVSMVVVRWMAGVDV